MSVTPEGLIKVTDPTTGRAVLVPATVLVDSTGAPASSEANPAFVSIVDGAVSQGEWIQYALTDDGTAGGAPEIQANYSVTPGRRWMIVPTGTRFDLYQIKMMAQNNAGGFAANNFVNIVSGLSVGIGLNAASGNGVTVRRHLFMAGQLKTNNGWYFQGNGFPYPATGGAKDGGFQWLLSSPLSVAAGDCIQAVLNDNFTGVDSLYFIVEGRLITL